MTPANSPKRLGQDAIFATLATSDLVSWLQRIMMVNMFLLGS